MLYTRPRRKRGARCRSRKRRFRTELDAKIVLARLVWKDTAKRRESRVYRCLLCGGWHLTSQEKRTENVTL